MRDLVIRAGAADISIENGSIAEVGPDLPAGREEIDATGLAILPGVIDGHVHFNEPGRTEWEGAATGSSALAAGGGTLFVDMPLNCTPCTVTAADFRDKLQALEQSSITDFALLGGLVPGSVRHMGELAELGVVGFKAFMCNSGLPEFPRADDLTLYDGMREAAILGLPVAVHAENEELTSGLARRAVEAGRTGIRDYLKSRPVLAEVEAIQRAALIALETGARLHIVHVSSGRGVEAALEARSRGADITIETCAHYLFFTEEDVERLGAAAKCAPPLRAACERESLWRHVSAGDVAIVASDHSPAPPAMKTGENFFEIWGGIAGVQSTLQVLLERDLPLSRIAELTASNPAAHFRFSRKGRIEVGCDADLVFVDLNASHTLRAQDLWQRHKISPYLGCTFRGRVQQTMLRGRTIFKNGRIMTDQPGRFVRPDPSYA